MEEKLIAEMKRFCDKNQMTSYRMLNRYAKNRRVDWLQVLCTPKGRTAMIVYCRELQNKYN